MFEIVGKAAKFASFNPRAEKNGDGTVLAADLRLSVNLDQHAIDALDPELRLWMFSPAADGTGDLADRTHPAPNLRQANIAPKFAWTKLYAGYELHVPHGISGRKDLVVQNCLLNKIELAPQEGGQVIVSFRLQFHPTEEQAGKLAGVIQTVRDISLLAPEGAEELADDPDGE